MDIKIRPLRADEVNCRIDQCCDGKARFLLYVDSRACRKVLDETFGIFGWQDTYTEIKDALYCTIQIWDSEKRQWISKQDCGTPSSAQKVKGEASDAFKRACFNLGIGRELYIKIPIYIPIDTIEKAGDNGRMKYEPKNKYLSFAVARIETNSRTQKIKYLCIVNAKRERVFEWGFSDYPYVNDELERARDALISYCEDYADLVGCETEQAFKAAFRGCENDGKGYAAAILTIKAKIQEAKEAAEKAQEAERTA